MSITAIIINNIQRWHRPSGLTAAAIWTLLLALLAITTAAVYGLGGTRQSTPHIYYLIVLLGSFFFRYAGGIGVAILAGLLAGPFMPLDTASGQMQSTINWLLRAAGFFTAGLSGALIVHFYELQIRALKDYFYSDWITDLPNRFRLEEIFRQTTKEHATAALIVPDARAFANLANTLGLGHGEELLLSVASRFKKTLPDDWTTIRLYSDRFAILAPGVSGLQAVDWVQERYPELTRNFEVRETPVYADFHFGVAAWPRDGATLFDLILNATLALDATREAGRFVALYSEDDRPRASRNFQLAAEFSRDLDAGRLTPYFQPRICVADNSLSGFEALVRWEHERRGRLTPDQFIPVLESTMLMRRLTEYMLRSSLAHWQTWRDRGHELRIAVNISGRDLLNPELYSILSELVSEFAVPAGSLELEITESEMILFSDASVALLKRIADLGIEIAVDDFGTGHASHAYLKHLPAKVIKIDRLFVQFLASDEKDQAIVGGVLDLARRLKATVIAEGVETREGLEYLRGVGCQKAQGYLIARPMPPAETLEWIASYDPSRGF
ncbi:MAG: GGDEF domain-containing phosphodiesterase [bacterium]|nr:GGDEF domain-containing phosphodiesterase [bacterium]